MKIHSYFITIFLFFTVLLNAQITLIPDANFENDLISQNIDSDGIINGQVITNDISNLTSLNLYNVISNLSGIEDFSSLMTLSIDNIDYSATNNMVVDFTGIQNLQTLNLYGGGDAITVFAHAIDLSANINIKHIIAPENWLLKEINLKTGTTDVSNLNIDISIIPFDFNLQNPNISDLFCIRVTNAAEATAGQGVYSSWTILADNNPYYFSETCNLNRVEFEKTNFNIYPNPTSDILNISFKNLIQPKIYIYDNTGRIVLESYLKNTNEKINIQHLEQGVYIIKLVSQDDVYQKRFIKK